MIAANCGVWEGFWARDLLDLRSRWWGSLCLPSIREIPVVCRRCDVPGFRILVVRGLDSWFRLGGSSRFCAESSILTGIVRLLGSIRMATPVPSDAGSSAMRDPFALRSREILGSAMR
jgi:hypothetical protein